MTNERSICPVCSGRSFRALPSPWPSSMTTAGHFIPEPLEKAHCDACGMLVRSAQRFLGQTDFYEKNYAFFERPSADVFDRPRYEAMATWIFGALNDYRPES